MTQNVPSILPEVGLGATDWSSAHAHKRILCCHSQALADLLHTLSVRLRKGANVVNLHQQTVAAESSWHSGAGISYK